jgi:rhamnosyltransferase subunit B
MNFILLSLGSLGDLAPFIWLSKVLKKNGHNVTLMTNSHFENIVKKNDISFISIGNTKEYQADKVKINESEKNLITKIQYSKKGLFEAIIKHTKEVYDKLSDLDTKDTILLGSFTTIGANIFAVKHNVKIINIILTPFQLSPASYLIAHKSNIKSNIILRKFITFLNYRMFNMLFGKHAKKIAEKLDINLPTKKSNHWKFTTDTLCLFQDWFVDLDFIEYSNVSFAGINEVEKPQNSFDDTLDFIEKNPGPILFNNGSAWEMGSNSISESLKALEILNKPGIFVTKKRDLFPDKLPKNIHITSYVPFDLILDKCSIIVHHGGIGSIFSSIKSAVPQIIFYILIEQKGNAAFASNFAACKYNSYKNISTNLIVEYAKELLNNKDKEKYIEISEKIKKDSSEKLFMDYINKKIK